MTPSPHTALSEADHGDDMQRRLRFQATAAAIWSLALYDDVAGLIAIYCEHHEDVLFHKTGDRFVGTQVKSKLDHLGPYRATDEEITHSIRRFVHLEETYPTRFDGYQISTNAGFWNENKTGANLEYILAAAANDDTNGKCPPLIAKYLADIFPLPEKPKLSRKRKKSTEEIAAETQATQTYEAAVKHREQSLLTIGRKVLKKIRVDKLHRMADARVVLISMLPQCSLVGDRFHSELGRIADALIDEMLKAGALAQETDRDRYLFLFDKPDEVSKCQVIAGKRITCERLNAVLQSCINAVPTLITSKPISIADLPTTLRTMERKMAAGGISIGNIELAKDLQASTEALLARWFHRDGNLADKRYQHVRTVVRTAAQEAYDKAFNGKTSFGQAMLVDIRDRLRQRFDEDPGAFFGCTYEHLLGMVSILTDDCTLWWSTTFAIPPLKGAS
jgi:Cap4 dsDNA endonuclease